MKMSPRGRQRLTDREGKRLVAYRDTQGVWTIGVGHTAAAGPPIPKRDMTITAQECDDILSRDLVHYENLINNAVKIPLADHEFDALVSIVYNVEAFAKSTAIKLLNKGDRAGCAKHIMDWNKPPEIIGRRHTEQSQFLTPYK
jgi:lysozyme